MRSIGILGMSVAALVLAGPAAARTYTLRGAVADAVVLSDSVAAAEAASDRAKAAADETLTMFTPGVTLSGGWAHLDTVPYVQTSFNVEEMLPAELLEMMETFYPDMSIEPTELRLEMGRLDMFQFQLQAEQILFAGTGLHRQRAMAMADLRSAREQERVARQEVVFQAEQLFWQLALARQAKQVTDEAIETAETHVGLLESFVEVGLASRADLMAARVQLASLRLTALRARQGAELAENAFRMIMHVPDGETVDLDLSSGDLPLDLPDDRDELGSFALESRPELRMLGHKHDATRHAAGAAWSSWLPAIALRANVYLKNPDRANEPEWYTSGDLQLGLQWQLWDRGAALHRNRQARAGMRQIDALRSQLRDGVDLQIEQALARLTETREQKQVANEAVALAEESLRLVQLNFGEGMARNVDVLEAQTALSRARLDALDAETSYRIAEASLRKAVGRDVE